MTWDDAWSKLNRDGKLVERPSQKLLADWMFALTEKGGTLLCEAPVGVGKSFAYLIPLIYQVRDGRNYRAVVSTETTALQDQLVDKDLPKLHTIFGGFKFRSLKGRSWYLCTNRAPNGHPVIDAVKNKNLGDGERRDVERVLGFKLSDDDWEEISGESDFCGQNKCKSEQCYSARARELAAQADIVVTNHSLLLMHAEYEILGDFEHLVVDEAHTLEKVLIDGWTFELSPYDIYKSMESLWKGIDAAYRSSLVPFAQEGERLMKEGLSDVTTFFTKMLDYHGDLTEDNWRRESNTLSLKFLSGSLPPEIITALENYELVAPNRFKSASDIFNKVADELKEVLAAADSGKAKLGKGLSAAKRLARTTSMMAESLETRDGIVKRYGIPYAVLADGWKTYKGEYNVRIRCVPLDVSQDARDNLWVGLKSRALLSGTLRDETDGTFNYVRDSLGLPNDSHTLSVGAVFDYQANQLVYVTPADREPIQVPGARYSVDEMVDLIHASDGRALVLFTAKAELEYAAHHLRNLQHRGEFKYRIFVQEKGVHKSDLVKGFVHDTHSVLLATKSFFTGVDFPGETCSIVVLAKFPLPQYNALCKAQIAWWRKRGYPRWYEREAMQVFRQANGRLIRSETDRGVIAILDQRVADKRENISKLTELEITTTKSALTNNIDEVTKWLGTSGVNQSKS